ncbi:MAG: serine/threonine protein kinase, partial [Elusimicrobia bacterium]|nr:serine/threonine protein kinase [Elusimicrobiota bacterium]
SMDVPDSRRGGFPWGALLVLILAGAVAAGAYSGWTLWKDLPAETRRGVEGAVRRAATGEALPAVSQQLRASTPMPSPAGKSLKPGDRVGSYEISRVVGRDGTVAVWKGRDTALERDVLIKRLYAGRDSGELALRRADARTAAPLHHPNIAELFDILELPEGLFAVYEYASGKPLRAVLEEKGSLSLRQARDVLVPVCRALEHAHHRGVVHGGLSPERVVLTRSGYIKVTDFVLARTTAAGGEAYAAPEVKRGVPTKSSDVYALGVMLHEILAGFRPGEGEWEPPPMMADLLERSLDLDARTRLESAISFMTLLQRADVTTQPPRPINAATTEDGPLVEPEAEESVEALSLAEEERPAKAAGREEEEGGLPPQSADKDLPAP